MQNRAQDPFGIVGQVLDAQFRVDRLVGEGGFSAVYRGFHLGLQEPIAIKCLKLPPAVSAPLADQFEKRFRDESRILYRLSQGNLNIVRSIASGTWESPTGFLVPFMVLEWLEGRSLANEFTIRRTVGNLGRPLAEVVKLFGPAADGLGYAHAQGVVHRDLNPGNLFLVSAPHGTKMKVLDFGVAKILDDSTLNLGPRAHTVGQIRIFAPAYGAPEQFDDGLGKVSAASDVYAFALILLEAMRDRCVNDAAHLGEFAKKAVDPKHRPTPRALGLDVPDEVEQIFARATTLDPRERWQSASELWQALAIATSAASQQRHAQAAMETPPLAMPSVSRGTKAGMGIPPPPQAKPAGLTKTLPINSVLPNLNAPRSPEAPAPLADPQDEPENEAKLMAASPRSPETASPSLGGTLMMQPSGFGPLPPAPQPTQRPPLGQQLGQTMPLAGPHPLGIPIQQGPIGPIPAAGATPPFQAPSQQLPSQSPMLQQQPPYQPAPPQMMTAQPLQHSVSMPASAASVPKKNNALLFAGVGAGILALIGCIGIALYLMNGRKESSVTFASASAATASVPIASASAPPPPIATGPAPATDVAEAGATAAEDTVDADTAPAATAVATRQPATDVRATVAPTAPAPAPASAPAPAKDKDAGPPDPNAWNEAAARSRLSQANSVLVFCKKEGGVTGPGTASVTFGTDGAVSGVTLNPPYAGTPAGDCVAGQFKRMKVNAFQGSPQTLQHSFEVPK